MWHFAIVIRFHPLGEEETVERELTFLGMMGIVDPPRIEVASAVVTCKAAGIRPVMITGDHPLTAQHIAAEIGIKGEGSAVSGAQTTAFQRLNYDYSSNRHLSMPGFRPSISLRSLKVSNRTVTSSP